MRQKAKLSTSNFDARNRIGVNMSAFDPDTGNQTAIGGYSFTYDGGGRMISAKSAGLSTGYVYDGDGQRIQKVACPGGTLVCTASVDQAVITTYVYDASGGLAAEYTSQSSTSACGTPTCYVSVDQIGSTRLLTDNSGAVIRRYDYLPYGEELWAGTGSRTTTMGYQSGPDGFNPKFTGQWRDTESRFDYFNARYYSPEQGRFVSPDPGNAGAQLGDPLTWHGYAYVGNNPLNVTDPDGLGFWSDVAGLFAGLFGSGEIWNTVQNDGPWNERLPGGSIGSLGGSVNTGGVFGGGQIGPGVFSFAEGANVGAKEADDLLTRVNGGIRVVGGAFELWSGIGFGVATSWSGVGAAAGGVVSIHGIDQIQAGLRQVYTGCQVDSLTSIGLQKAGVSQRTANLVDSGLSVVGSLGTSIATQAIRASGVANIIYYEIGQKTMSAANYAQYGKIASPVARGRQLVADQGLLRALAPTTGQYGRTIGTGTTPLASGSIGAAAGAYTGSRKGRCN